MFKPVSSQISFPDLEEEILKFWKEEKIFEESISSRPESKKWTFLDGPPFITGTPHYGTLLSSIPKDIYGRFWTMKGFKVRRVWGWDGHGLPIENKVETELNIKRKKDIEEKVGVKNFIEECLKYVNKVSGEWEWYIDHIGRWVDFKNAYKTWDLEYMESVMWVFSQMYKKDLIYKGFKVSLYCPHCSTPISNFEVAMDADNYKDVTEATAVYKYPLSEQKDTFLLAWSTTPWNKLVTPALAVNPKLKYVKVKQGSEYYILAKPTLKILNDRYEILDEFKGEKLIGEKFEPHYNFYKIDKGNKAFIVIGGDFVTSDEGTGVVTLAVYGEEDLTVMQKENIQKIIHLDEEGMILESIPNFGGMYYLKANSAVIQDLESRDLIYRIDQYTHSVPHCWRCGTRLYYAPIDAWFVNVQILKKKMFKNNESINWFPKHFKTGRFLKSMESAPDWNISRNRYWGSPVPVWQCECGEVFVPGSVQELEDASGAKIKTLHKPEIDDIKIKCKKCNNLVERVSEVLDSWIEAGSASFAERHFPFSEEKLEDFFPPDFIAEYTGQIRAWFYVIHVISTALYDSSGFKNVLVEGVLLGTDGRKMSKNYGNFPDPKEVMQKYGGDALRLYFSGSPLMHGEDMNFSEDGVAENYRFLLIFWNTYKFFVDYANLYKWNISKVDNNSLSVLDRWIISSLEELTDELNKGLNSYESVTNTQALKDFILNDFSTWYIRRSRDRVGPESDREDREVCLSVIYEVLVTLTKLAAPFIPFITEKMFKSLTGGKSVHLQDYPTPEKSLIDVKLASEMTILRKLAEFSHAKRKGAGVKLRQPLSNLTYFSEIRLSDELEKILSDELNVKNVVHKKFSTGDLNIELDTKITPLLKEEGEARELIRQIQQLRKEANLTLSDKTKIEAPLWPKSFENQILKSTASLSITKAKELKVIQV